MPAYANERRNTIGKSRSADSDAAKDIHDVYEVECATFFAPNLLSFATDGREFHYGSIGQPVAEETAVDEPGGAHRRTRTNEA